jgi:cag pathogenicity island protein 24
MIDNPKYRLLNQEELEILKDEFVQFLISNGIDAPKWLAIKDLDQNEAQLWISKFSDIVLQKSLEKIQYLEFRSAHRLMLFHCQKECIQLAAVTSEHTDLSDFGEKEMVASIQSDLAMFTQTKTYQPDRETEIFGMLQNGALVTDESLFNWVFQTVEKLKNLA